MVKRQSSRTEDKYDVTHLAKNMIQCGKCQKLFYDVDHESLLTLQHCNHEFCKACLGKYIHQDFIKFDGHLKCLEEKCGETLAERDYLVISLFFLYD